MSEIITISKTEEKDMGPRFAKVAIIQQVWEKAAIIPDRNPLIWRKDCYQNLINRNEYGNRKSDWGWEIDHIILASEGGSNLLPNLRPLQWRSNASKQTGAFPFSNTALVQTRAM